jgi:hypothetical protein
MPRQQVMRSSHPQPCRQLSASADNNMTIS